jgi:hypothetical protein
MCTVSATSGRVTEAGERAIAELAVIRLLVLLAAFGVNDQRPALDVDLRLQVRQLGAENMVALREAVLRPERVAGGEQQQRRSSGRRASTLPSSARPLAPWLGIGVAAAAAGGRLLLSLSPGRSCSRWLMAICGR